MHYRTPISYSPRIYNLPLIHTTHGSLRSMATIEPKPTTYAGIQFRSRLEARVAVFLDNHPSVREWRYEPFTLTLPKENWEYTPDFEIHLNGPTRRKCPDLLIEVKPDTISKEYRYFLEKFANLLNKHYGYDLALPAFPLYLLVADFYRFDFKLTRISSGPSPSLTQLFPAPLTALQTAAMFRFDLLNP